MGDSKWYGTKHYFGLHYDYHVKAVDRNIGSGAESGTLAAQFRRVGFDFVQGDCKGSEGLLSYPSLLAESSVGPGLTVDLLGRWREGARQLALPFHCHYTTIIDPAAARRHPEWRVVPAAVAAVHGGMQVQNQGSKPSEKMCPRSDYVEKLMIPQMRELIDRYDVNGFWTDADMWAVEPCYCSRCLAAFEAETGIVTPPTDATQPAWVQWINFTRAGFEQYVTRYVEAVHHHRPGVKVCSNWMQTFNHPGEPITPTDWISGDCAASGGLDNSRCEARFISTRGKPWDLMFWTSYWAGEMFEAACPWTFKSTEMMCQELCHVLALGGNVMLYLYAGPMRDGSLVDWQMDRVAEVGRFVRSRQSLCQETTTVPHIAVLHSEYHWRDTWPANNILWGGDTAPTRGAAYALLDSQMPVDILDEWALIPILNQYPAVVIGEQTHLSEQMVIAVQNYVRGGGRLLLVGAKMIDRFGEDFVGASITARDEAGVRFVETSDAAVPIYSATWTRLSATSASPAGAMRAVPTLEPQPSDTAAYLINRVGSGQVTYVPYDLFRAYEKCRYPQQRELIATLVREAFGALPVTVNGPRGIDVVVRRKGNQTIIHLLNRTSGTPGRTTDTSVDEVPPVGPVHVLILAPMAAENVELEFESAAMTWKCSAAESGVQVDVTLASVHLHAAIAVTWPA